MGNLNKVVLVGRLVSDPEARSSADGVSITKFKLLVESLPNQAPDIIDIVTWDKIAETSSKFLKAGKLILIEGRISVRNFEDQLGQKKWVTEVVASTMQMLDKSGGTVAKSAASQKDAYEDVEELPEGDLPF